MRKPARPNLRRPNTHCVKAGTARKTSSPPFAGKREPFSFTTLGQLAIIGRRTGVANILGLHVSGLVAWWLWRTIYLMKLPRFEKKLRVALSWTLDLFFPKTSPSM